jgi:predicted membrane protein
MFKQVKSALFWYYLFKFRRRVILIVLLLIIAFFANAIYGDVVEYLKLKDKLAFLEIALISKWLIIVFNIVFSIYLLLTMFKNEEEQNSKKEPKKDSRKEEAKRKETKKEEKKEEKFTAREKEFLYKKKLRSKADLLVENGIEK